MATASGPKTRYRRLSSRMHWAALERHLMGAMHQDLILDQFTRQASPFSAAAMITDEAALGMIVEAAQAT